MARMAPIVLTMVYAQVVLDLSVMVIVPVAMAMAMVLPLMAVVILHRAVVVA